MQTCAQQVALGKVNGCDYFYERSGIFDYTLKGMTTDILVIALAYVRTYVIFETYVCWVRVVYVILPTLNVRCTQKI